MRRWNGWGEENLGYPLPESGARFLANSLGSDTLIEDVALANAVCSVPESRLPYHPLVSTDSEVRVRHSCGQSLPDWVALRTGQIQSFPDGVAFPSNQKEVSELLVFAENNGFHVIPYGGGTSVVGHINPLFSETPTLTLSCSRLDGFRLLDNKSQLAVFGAGILGPNLEKQLNKRGFTLGHFPQSFEYSTLGGWIATRSSGQQSLRYGRIEDLFAGGCLVTPVGILKLKPFPASAAGPDLRQLILGSEGRLGILTEATVRVARLPEREHFHAVFFSSWANGIEAVREMVQIGLPLSMLRLSDSTETATTLALAGREWFIRPFEQLLRIVGFGGEKCLLLFGVTGSTRAVRMATSGAIGVCRGYGGIHVGRLIGNAWRNDRFHTPYLRNTLWERGYAVDTLETAVEWAKVDAVADAVKKALRTALEDIGEKVLVFSHISHVYPDGASVYFTYLYRLPLETRIAVDNVETLRRWFLLKRAASETIARFAGTISHHHGVGIDHLPYMLAEKGEIGEMTIRQLCRLYDPSGIMNPGKLVEVGPKTPTSLMVK